MFNRVVIGKDLAKISCKKLLPLMMFTFLCLNLKTFSQNDVCASATALSTGTTAGTITSSFTNYTSDPVPSCESATNKCSWSGWYKYTTGASGGSLTISMAVGTLRYGSLTLYSGSCGSFTELSCNDPNVSAAKPSITTACLTANTTYYLMVWCDGTPGANTYYGTYTLTTTFLQLQTIVFVMHQVLPWALRQ